MKDDLIVTEKWLECHVSDYSCFQHRQTLLAYLFESVSKSKSTSSSSDNINDLRTPLDLLWREFQVLNSLFPLYHEQESLLLHRRFLLNAATKQWCPEQTTQLREKETDFFRYHITPILRKSNAETWQLELLRRYLAYLERNLNWKFTHNVT